jgi:2-polyprenyl-3-methyl-5-hydroxy-6-metoxy-1,4-benzoquinol methylase
MGLAGRQDGIGERFDPNEEAGRLIEAEHVARYLWAAAAAAGRRVLDAGCGTAYGAKLLAQAGATEVVGVDIAADVLDAVASGMPDNVRLEAGDLRCLRHPPGSFELVVCFEVIEHFDDPFAVLDELVRVLHPTGTLLVSSPNRGVFPPGNPHHRHEFVPDELLAALRQRLANVRLVRQHDYLLSAALEDDAFARADGAPIQQLRVHKLVGGSAGSEVYTLAVASDGELPQLDQLAVLTGTLELRDWISLSAEQTAALRLKDSQIAELQARVAERERIAALLVDAEQRVARIPALELALSDLREELEESRRAEESLRQQIRALEADLFRARRTLVEVVGSPSWRLTKPLRSVKRLLRR